MTSNSNNLYDPNIEESKKSKENKYHFLTLHNDDINTFEYVIDNLIEICNHDSSQAEQCAYITHYKGKCDVKKGNLKHLKPLKTKLSEKGLLVSID
ncbi:MAG: ATP-dependent Clp protease adaptor ClpS [Bacteroidales bacterium]|nr:ATP-dependent Clp protease adaptor ClpS [Bacteroidales bacterium]